LTGYAPQSAPLKTDAIRDRQRKLPALRGRRS
jgi:hypothetical protein